MMNEISKWIITGGSGFLGTEVCSQLKASDYDVTSFDKLPPKYEYSWNFLQGLLSKPEILNGLNLGTDFGVVHAAALKSVTDSINDPIGFEKNNYADSVTFFNYVMKLGCKHFIFISSAAVYGDKNYTVGENEFCQPISQYGKTKFNFERYLLEQQDVTGCKITIVRPFNLIGTNCKNVISESVISIVIKSIQSGSEFLFRKLESSANSSEPVRDYINVQDVAKLVSKICKMGISEPRILNASSGVGTKLSDLISEIEAECKVKVKIADAFMDQGEIEYSVGSNDLACSNTNWLPETSLRESILQEYQAIINE